MGTEGHSLIERHVVHKNSMTQLKKMKKIKNDRCDNINQVAQKKNHNFQIGQSVYIKNHNRNIFEPLFLEEPWIVESFSTSGIVIHKFSVN